MIATAIASSHIRIRPQWLMFTTSEIAPIVQKFARAATTPNANARTNPPHTTIAAVLMLPVMISLVSLSRSGFAVSRRLPRQPQPPFPQLQPPAFGAASSAGGISSAR
ncbi:MAG: hypothetical protein AMXMBFR72_30620 [Betaproteobacteria bacterium]